ncbi:MAG: DUF177 domain-containing protein [Deltaproteobacteria bacterium]|nr:DUF177 domain-containing protein [Deltaproteobacteria bacterium]
MIIHISEIESEATFSGAIEGKEMGSVYDLLTPVEYHLRIKKSGINLKVEGHIYCVVALTCARCLDRFGYEIDTDLELELVASQMAPTDTELELEKGELDVHYYESDELDISEIIQEEVILNIPMRVLCREECLGLCEICGTNKNVGECTCGSATVTRLGELLKSYLKKEGENHGSAKEKTIKIKKG